MHSALDESHTNEDAGVLLPKKKSDSADDSEYVGISFATLMLAS
jgi:hypothetical protein